MVIYTFFGEFDVFNKFLLQFNLANNPFLFAYFLQNIRKLTLITNHSTTVAMEYGMLTLPNPTDALRISKAYSVGKIVITFCINTGKIVTG